MRKLFTRCAEETTERWYILSAKYGLAAPDEVIEPYEICLARTTASYRRQWGITPLASS